MGYEDYIEPRCKGCEFHKVRMCDVDMVASSCEKIHAWCSTIKSCSKWINDSDVYDVESKNIISLTVEPNNTTQE